MTKHGARREHKAQNSNGNLPRRECLETALMSRIHPPHETAHVSASQADTPKWLHAEKLAFLQSNSFHDFVRSVESAREIVRAPHCGGATPLLPRSIREACNVPSGSFLAIAKIATPACMSALVAEAKVTIGISGGMTTFLSPPL